MIRNLARGGDRHWLVFIVTRRVVMVRCRAVEPSRPAAEVQACRSGLSEPPQVTAVAVYVSERLDDQGAALLEVFDGSERVRVEDTANQAHTVIRAAPGDIHECRCSYRRAGVTPAGRFAARW